MFVLLSIIFLSQGLFAFQPASVPEAFSPISQCPTTCYLDVNQSVWDSFDASVQKVLERAEREGAVSTFLFQEEEKTRMSYHLPLILVSREKQEVKKELIQSFESELEAHFRRSFQSLKEYLIPIEGLAQVEEEWFFLMRKETRLLHLRHFAYGTTDVNRFFIGAFFYENLSPEDLRDLRKAQKDFPILLSPEMPKDLQTDLLTLLLIEDLYAGDSNSSLSFQKLLPALRD